MSVRPAPALNASEDAAAAAADARRARIEARIWELDAHLETARAELQEVSADAASRVLATSDHAPAEEYQRRIEAHATANRALRFIVALQLKCMAELQKLGRQPPEARIAAERARAEREQLKKDRKAQLRNVVERVAERERDRDQVGRLAGEVVNRLFHDDRYGDVLEQPMSELVAALCRDLDLTPDWARLATEAWARAEIASGAPGEPLEAFIAGPRFGTPPREAAETPDVAAAGDPRAASP